MALPPSTANWHWKNKNVTPWAKEWLQTELTKLSVSGDDGESVSIAEVTSVEGDVELGQRKSKLLTIFDCDVRARWTGTTSSGTQVEGTLRIPEISHEIICDQLEDYRYEWSLKTASSTEVDAVYKLARSRLPAALEAKLATFPSTIVEVHGKDVYIGGTASGQSTPPVVSAAPTSAAAPSASAAPAKAASAPVKKTAKPANTSTITVEASFQASADDLFGLLTDEKRIPAWTRNSAVSQAKPETQYSLFGGGVKGTYVSLTPGKEIIQTWALQSPTWPQGHEATLTIAFDQSTDSTKVTFTLTGVPTGMEDELRRNIEGYYVHGFKSIGLGSVL
ncbi:chaperone activator [Coprinopsis sp. MPI-PUGE-AT-0042]|nr:chaperone activator [Coprinopsis sp. MPI-PUGE-AT-0042]